MTRRLQVIVFSAGVAASLVWLESDQPPVWLLVPLLVLALPLGLFASARQKRSERRLMRSLWNAATGK